MEVDLPSGGAGSANIEVVQDPDEVILERDEDESDLDEDDDPLGNEAPEQDEKTPLDTRLAAMKWEDAGVVNEDTRKPRHDPDNFEPAVRPFINSTSVDYSLVQPFSLFFSCIPDIEI